MLALVVVLATLARSVTVVGPGAPAISKAFAVSCQAHGALRVSIETDRVTARDTVVSARLCLTVPTTGSRLASMSGRVTIDTTFARVVAAQGVPRSGIVANVTGADALLFAGAASASFRGGTLLTFRARVVRPGVLPRVTVALTELNAQNGRSLVTTARTAGVEPRCLGTTPAIFQVLPAEASTEPAEPLEVRITGCAFHATDNTVRFAGVDLRHVRSTNGGTRIRLVLPKHYASGGEAPPMPMSAGVYDLSVSNGRAMSNLIHVTLR